MATVANFRDGHGWNILFRRNLNDWELDSYLMTSLLSLMQPWTISNGKEPPKDAFTVRSCYTLLEKPAPIPLWPWKTIWWSKASYKVKYHFDDIKEAYLTPNNFQLSNRCCLCKKKEENINHFFLHRKYNSQFWDMVFNILEMKIIFLAQLYILLRLWCNMALSDVNDTLAIVDF
ncbi:hypothetical protein KY285_020937 [Solanum tuberosum]|nr:hypothetical protein KY285_020937 [Solanum tuberosum]